MKNLGRKMKARIILLIFVLIIMCMPNLYSVYHKIGNFDSYYNDDAVLITVSDTLAYIILDQTGLHILNVSDPENPIDLGNYSGFSSPESITLFNTAMNTIAYIADGEAGLKIIDVSDPTNPILIGNYDTPDEAKSVAISYPVAYVTDNSTGLLILNISNPSNPTVLGEYVTDENATSVKVQDNIAYVAINCDGWQGAREVNFIDVNDPSNPTLVGSYNPQGHSYINDFDIVDTKIYIGAGDEIVIVDISNISSPTLLGNVNIFGSIESLVFSENKLYVACGYCGFQVFDVTDPSASYIIGDYYNDALSIDVNNTIAYIAANYRGLDIIDISEPSNPFLIGTNDTSSMIIGVNNNYLFSSNGYNEELHCFNLSNPMNPELINTYSVANGHITSFDIYDHYCPVISRIKSIGYDHGAIDFCNWIL